MNDLTFIKDYKNKEHYRLSFNALATSTFGINFEPWFQKGFWNERYICYSFAEGEQVVSNVSINLMDVMWQGQKKRAIQIGTVMTHPEYRKRGLASRLMKIVLEENENDVDFIYLFGNDSALGLYLKFGFEPVVENKFSMVVNKSQPKENRLRKLDISKEEDLKLISRLSLNRKYISQTLGVSNDQALIMFYCMYVFSDDIFYLEEEDAIVIYTVEGDVLNLHDIISTANIDLELVISKLVSPEVTRVVIHFTPKLITGKVDVEILEKDDCTLLMKPLPKEITDSFLFPSTSHA